MKKARESNIELLRILTICGVVMLHYNGNVAFGLVTEGTANYHLLQFLEVLFICAVNLFVMISGYFLCTSNKRKAVKALELVVQVMVLGMGKYLVLVVFGAPFSLASLLYAAIPNNYYVTLYLAVYLLSPYMNLAISKLSDKKLGVLVVLCGVLFALWPTVLDMIYATTGHNYNGMYPTNSGGSQYGYSFLNFALMYLLGAYLRRIGPGRGIYDALGAGACLAILFIWQTYCPSVARAYSNPLVILMAVFVFRLFSHVYIQSKVINTLAKGTFTCFLLHDFFLPHIGIAKVVNGSLPVLLGHIALSIPLIFLVCWVAWFVYDLVSRPVFRLLEKPLQKVDDLLSITDNEE